MLLLFVLAACSSSNPATFGCGKLLCTADQYCLHFEVDSGVPADGGQVCMDLPSTCGGTASCDCVDACLSDCSEPSGEDGLSCWGVDPAG